MTTTVEKTIQVDAPVTAVYNQWTQFEEFPQFMGGVQQVQQLDDKRLHWVAEIAGVKREWDAEILEQVPDQKVSWAATEGATNAGAVYFTPAGTGQTLVRLHLEYEPEGLVEKAGDFLNIVDKRAQADLEKFKSFIEARGVETGGWRGEIADQPQIGSPGVEDAAQTRGDSGKAGVSGKAMAAGAAAAGAGVAAAAAMKSRSGGTAEPMPAEPSPMLREPGDTMSTTEPVGADPTGLVDEPYPAGETDTDVTNPLRGTDTHNRPV